MRGPTTRLKAGLQPSLPHPRVCPPKASRKSGHGVQLRREQLSGAQETYPKVKASLRCSLRAKSLSDHLPPPSLAPHAPLMYKPWKLGFLFPKAGHGNRNLFSAKPVIKPKILTFPHLPVLTAGHEEIKTLIPEGPTLYPGGRNTAGGGP